MIKFKNITIRNFLSVGAVTQSINFENRSLTLILGENLDQGGNGARNGVGKSTILQALSYALFDKTVTSIKRDNLINKTNNKNMLVTVDFEIDGIMYRVERGRRKNIFKFLIDGVDPDQDVAQGENRNTQQELLRSIGMSHDMFMHIVVLNTYTQPFLFLKAGDQRAIIEELISITRLSEKSDNLRSNIKMTKDSIREEEIQIKTIEDSNAAITQSINKIKGQSALFERNKIKHISDYADAIESLLHIDIENELVLHKLITEYKTDKNLFDSTTKMLSQSNRLLKNAESKIISYSEELQITSLKQCHTCKQDIHDEDAHKAIEDNINNKMIKLSADIEKYKEDIIKYNDIIDSIGTLSNPGDVFYPSIDDAYQHKQNLNEMTLMLETENNKENPFDDQIVTLETTALKEIDYATLNDVKQLLEHQEFLFKLLTSKDSFIRKKIIDQNLAFLNSRMNHYLVKMGLPHNVEFKNDLTVEIVLLGQEFDFGQLSRGQQNRLILALSWAFRDVWESTNRPINLLFIDEMIDSGIDTVGVENTLEILKGFARDRNKEVFLISHKEELINRIGNLLTVTLENGFTSYS